MVTFWDTSAIVPLLVEEPTSTWLRAYFERNRRIVVWWLTRVECASAISRMQRDSLLDDAAVLKAEGILRQLASDWREVDPSDRVRDLGSRFVRVHPLRAADALQLAAAYDAAEGR